MLTLLILIAMFIFMVAYMVYDTQQRAKLRADLDKFYEKEWGCSENNFENDEVKPVKIVNKTWREEVESLTSPRHSGIRENVYYKVGDGEYYIVVALMGVNPYSHQMLHHRRILRFVDGEILWWNDENIKLIENKDVFVCEDPHKEHWQHFLHLEMLKKQKRQQECHKFVDRILAKHEEYNNLHFKYEMSPHPPIVDIFTLRNFCDMVHEDIEFEDFEIQNYLLVKQQKH